jgi:sterol desaturase/sphingolipid hydroxylase (fatty acid hydroxylase superfamily)
MSELVFVIALVAIAGLERWPALRFESLPLSRRGSRADFACFLTGSVGLALAARALALAAGVSIPVLRSALGELPLPLAILGYDLGAYLSHWLLHRVPALWRLHQVHHSSPSLDWLATFRAHLGEHALRHTLSGVALIAAGLPLPAVAWATAIHSAWAVFGHANFGRRLACLEPWLVTPRLHRLHHVATSGDHNLGTFFTLWDRARGKLISAPDAALAPLGVPGRIASYPDSWLDMQLEPFRSAAARAPGASEVIPAAS